MSKKIYESGEMYLETILRLKETQETVRFVDIVKETKKAKSTVSQALTELKTKSFLKEGPNGELLLTKKGRKVAEDIYEKHCILTEFFIKLGVDPRIAEEDSCKFEHDINEETFQAIKKALEKGEPL